MSLAKSLSSERNEVVTDFAQQLWSSLSSYREVCQASACNDAIFSNFKRHPCYRSVLEHVSYEQGLSYILEIQKKKNIDLKRDRNSLKLNDVYGNPEIVHFQEDGDFAPTTLRYTKVVSDLIEMLALDATSGKINVVEIGVGYGGQCLLMDQFINIETYTLIDISPALNLAKTYLENFSLRCKVQFLTSNEIAEVHSDLCISNYAFSELNKTLQDCYIHKVIRHAKNGYMAYNHTCDNDYSSYTALEFSTKVPNGTLIDEIPLTHPMNVIVTWHE